MPKQHSVAQGDTLVSIANQYGFRSWEAIWNHDDNADLRKRRDPFVLAPGDVVVVPDKKPRLQPVATGRQHTFRLRTLKAQVRLALADEDGEAFASRKFELVVDGKTIPGSTNGHGLVDVEVPATATSATLKLFVRDGVEPLEWELSLGHLDPLDTDAGVIQRLRNLGYDVGTAAAPTDEAAKKALRAFQNDKGLPATGILDPKSRETLGKASVRDR